jgi:hypothetical protein
MRGLHWISLAILALAIGAVARFFLARQETAALQSEITLLRDENRQLAELRAEHERLVATKISDSELERLRSDRAALGRLRAEINQLEETAERKTRAALEPERDQLRPLVLNVAMGTDGGLLLDGAPADPEAMRQLLAGLARRSERVEIRLRADPAERRTDLIKSTIDGLVKISKEVGLKVTLRFDNSAK